MSAVTVAITTHNLEKYLESCFSELEAQTFQDFSVLVYDDCSNDRTRELLARLQLRWGERLDVILGDVPQKLPAKSRNKILDSGRISGKYVVFLDGDDSIEPNYLMELYTAAEKTGADIAVCAYDRVEEESGHILCTEMKGYPESCTIGTQTAPSLAFMNTALWNKLIRTDRIGELRMPEFSVGEDAAFMLEIYSRCRVLAFSDSILIHYRVRAASVISNTPEESIYRFAEELYRLWRICDEPWLKDNIALAAFIHIGISMPMRAYDNPDVNTADVLDRIREYFVEKYNWFHGNRYLCFTYLARQGVKGFGIYAALLFHKAHCFHIFLLLYKTMVRFLRIEIKF